MLPATATKSWATPELSCGDSISRRFFSFYCTVTVIANVCDAPGTVPLGVVPAMEAFPLEDELVLPVEDVLEPEFVLELEPPPHEANVTNAASVINANAALR